MKLRKSTIRLVVGASVVLCLVIQVRPYWVSGSSMEPTLPDGSLVLALRTTWWTPAVHRGQVVVLHDALGSDQYTIKRVVGLAGDCIDPAGRLANSAGLPCVPVHVGRVFVVGDNSPVSSDSRRLGQVAQESVVATLLVCVLGC